jgi:hypothetical protein
MICKNCEHFKNRDGKERPKPIYDRAYLCVAPQPDPATIFSAAALVHFRFPNPRQPIFTFRKWGLNCPLFKKWIKPCG